MQLLLLIFSKRLDNLLSVCGALDFFWSCRASIYRKYAFRDLLPSPFSLLYFSISSRIVFFNTLSISFLSAFPLLYFCFQIEHTCVFQISPTPVTFALYERLNHLKRNRSRFTIPKFCRSSTYVIAIVKFSNNRPIQTRFNFSQRSVAV